MSLVGPELPPHLAAKRKREDDEDEKSHARAHPASRSRSSSNDGADKKKRILGPSLPPANLDERPTTAPSGVDDSDSDDDIGPALPPPPGHYDPDAEILRSKEAADEELARKAASKPKREEWMLVPPKRDDWSSRIDPTKLKNRKFNTGKGAKGPAQKGGGDNTLWTETPEEKLKRLEDEVMGVKRPAHLDQESHKSAKSRAEARETERRIREYNEKNRKSSLYDEHQKTAPREKEDDPSQRAFDKEKDIGGGMKIGHAKRKELITRAGDFGSRFAKGSYL
ncbi:hypothetical protein MMC26_004293 [Xylographa opegraphella]|nr:hypothetical protein [Xylographa opegraphella]